MTHTFGISVASVAVGLLGSVAVARLAGPEGKGGYDLSLATAVLLSTLFGLSLNSGITFVVARGIAAPRLLVTRLGWYLLPVGGLTGVLLLAIERTPMSTALLAEGIGPQLIVPVTLLVVLITATGYLRAVLVGWQEIVAANWRDMAGRLATLAIIVALGAILAMPGRRLSSVELVWAGVAGAAITLALFGTVVLRRLGASSGRSGVREAVAFSLPAYLGNVAQFLSYRLDLFLVGYFLGIGGVGMYALAVSLAQLLWIVSNSAAAVMFPRVSAIADRSLAARETAQISRVALALTIVAAVALASVAGALLPAVYGPAFAPAVEPLLWLLPGIVAFAVTNVLAAYVAGVGRPGLNAAVSMLGVLVTVPLDLLLIPPLGIVGAAVASSASYTVSTVATLIVFRRLGGVGAVGALLPRRGDLAMLAQLAARFRSAPGAAGTTS